MYVIQRLREPSTWAGIAAAAVAVGANPDKVNVMAQAVAGILSALAVFLPEKKAQ